MATPTVAPVGVAAPAMSSDHWTRYSATVFAICFLGWVFDVYESTIMQITTPLLIEEMGITPATMGFVSTVSRWIGLTGTFLFPVVADLYGRRTALMIEFIAHSVLPAVRSVPLMRALMSRGQVLPAACADA